jgi:crotonobetainyl-CoA:carnitine CoA-transferase CaiB-like acyl-CoA transferase
LARTGPYRDKKAYDPIIQGMTGLMSITGEQDGSPVKIGIPVTDMIAASHAVTAILAAYIHRLETGKGQYIDVSLYDGVISWLTIMAMDYFATGTATGALGLDHIHRVPARAFLASDNAGSRWRPPANPCMPNSAAFWGSKRSSMIRALPPTTTGSNTEARSCRCWKKK